MKCKKCGAEVPMGAIICPRCGAQIEVGTVRCAACGAKAKAGLSLCPHCGAELEYGRQLSFPFLPALSGIALIALAFFLYSFWPFHHVELPEFSAVASPPSTPMATFTLTPLPTPTYTAIPALTSMATPTPIPSSSTPTAVPTVISTPRLAENPTAVLWDVPSYRQKHPLSCEAASLRMVFLYFGIDVSEDRLIQEIGYDTTPLQFLEDEGIIWGDPNEGYIGNIDGKQLSSITSESSFDEHSPEIWGYGVYQDPLIRVAKKHGFLTAEISRIGQMYRYLRYGWLIIAFVPSSGRIQAVVWEWRTPDGESIKVMNGEHAIVVKGYDENYIYVKDSLGKVTRYSPFCFELAWNHLRMGIALKYHRTRQGGDRRTVDKELHRLVSFHPP